MTRADEFQKNAEAAEASAAKAKDLEVKQAYLDIARQWRAMIEYAERKR